jgi:hypothetical protein
MSIWKHVNVKGACLYKDALENDKSSLMSCIREVDGGDSLSPVSWRIPGIGRPASDIQGKYFK